MFSHEKLPNLPIEAFSPVFMRVHDREVGMPRGHLNLTFLKGSNARWHELVQKVQALRWFKSCLNCQLSIINYQLSGGSREV